MHMHGLRNASTSMMDGTWRCIGIPCINSLGFMRRDDLTAALRNPCKSTHPWIETFNISCISCIQSFIHSYIMYTKFIQPIYRGFIRYKSPRISVIDLFSICELNLLLLYYLTRR